MLTSASHKNGTHIPNGLAVLFEDKKKIAAAINDSFHHLGNAKIRETSSHLFSAGGKMLRSSLVATAYKAVGGKADERILSVAAAIEIAHNWSLVHDDIIDKSATRRGVPTVHEKWNTNTAILTGDAMNNLVYLLMIRSGFDAFALRSAMQCVAEASLQLIDGELMDIEFEVRTDVKEKDYFEMINKKTAALIACAAKVGALLGTEKQSHIHAIENYGSKIGTAFQIKDDLLDLMGNKKDTGKDFAGDIREGKKTLLVLHALSNALPIKVRRLVEIINGDAVSDDDIFDAIEIMQEAGSFDYAYRILAGLIDEAKNNLRILPGLVYINALDELADFIGQPEMIKAEYPLYTI